MVKIKRFHLLIGIHWVLVLPFWTMWQILILNNYSGSKLGVHLIQSPYSIDFANAPDVREIFGLGNHTILPASFYGWNVIDITRNHKVIQVHSSLVCSSDLKIANQNNNLLTTMIIDDLEFNVISTVEEICISMIYRFDRLMFLFRDMEGNTLHLNGEFVHRLTIEERIEGEGIPTLMSTNQFVWLKYLRVGRRRRSGTTLFHSISVPSRPCRSIPISCAQRLNRSSGTDQCRDIPTRGDYDIETVIAVVNASDAFPVRIGV